MQLDEEGLISALGHKLVRTVRLLLYMRNIYSLVILCCEDFSNKSSAPI